MGEVRGWKGLWTGILEEFCGVVLGWCNGVVWIWKDWEGRVWEYLNMGQEGG